MLSNAIHGLTPLENQRMLENWITDQSPETLGVIYRIVQDIFMTPDSESGAMYWMGHMTAVQRIRHNACPCGINHDHELLEQERKQMEQGVPAQDVIWSLFIAQGPGGVVLELDIDEQTGRARCKNCNHVFASVHERLDNGPSCPKCNWSPAP